MKTLKFKITATITKIIDVEVDDTNLTSEEVEDIGREMAHESFNPLNDGYEEHYTEDSVILS